MNGCQGSCNLKFETRLRILISGPKDLTVGEPLALWLWGGGGKKTSKTSLCTVSGVFSGPGNPSGNH